MTQHVSHTRIPLILTRPTRASLSFWSSLTADLQADLDPVVSPLLTIGELAPEDGFPVTDAVVFSSANGVAHGPKGDGRTAYCVGKATAEEATRQGWDGQCAGATADELVATLSAMSERPSLLHISGQHTRGDIVGRLHDAGFAIHHAIAYDQSLEPLTPAAYRIFAEAQPCLVPIFSPRTAAQLVSAAPNLESAHLIALSRPIAMSLAKTNCASLTIAEEPTADAMRAAVATWLKARPSS